MGKKIMVVDDAMFMRKVICKNLQASKCSRSVIGATHLKYEALPNR